MKNIFVLVFSLFTLTGFAQTPFSMITLHDDPESNAYLFGRSSISSVENAWWGSNLAYNINGDVGNSILIGARAMYMAASGDDYGVPVLTNVGLSPDSAVQGNFTLGILPFYTLVANDRLKLLLHGGFNYEIPDLRNTDETEFNMLLGIQTALYPREGGMPFTLSIAPEYSMSIQEDNINGWSLGIEGVVPVTGGLGILLKSDTPLNSQIKTNLAIGIIVNGGIK